VRAAAAGLLAALCCAQEITIFRPADQTVVPPGALSVAARVAGKAELMLDRKPVPAAQPAPNALMASLKIAPGRHELTVSSGGVERKIAFFAGPGAPADWKPFRPHPPAASCDTCHAVRGGSWAFKNEVLADTCFACHEAKQFPAIHSHTPEVLAECQLCHSPHGSTEARHLKFKKEVACKQCHG
jgi:predicted CXXCH cytochrome family protein